MSWIETFKDYLIKLDILEENQIKVYYELLGNKENYPLRANIIADRTGLNRSYIYSVLKVLQDKGLVTTIEGNPLTYIANSPKKYINYEIENKKKLIGLMEEFKAFIETVVEPEFEKNRKLSTIPLREVYTIDSILTLVTQVTNQLKLVKQRMLVRCPSYIINLFKEELEDAIIRLTESNHALYRSSSIRILTNDSSNLLLQSKKFVLVEKPTITNVSIVIDQNVFLFNIHSEIFETPIGIGLIIKDREIADSYTYQLLDMFDQIFFSQISKTQPDVDPKAEYADDSAFMTAINSLLQVNWKIYPYNKAKSYFELISPDNPEYLFLKKTGISYVPMKRKITEQDLHQMLQEAIRETKNSLKYEIEHNFLQLEYVQLEETIEGFVCKTMASITKFNPKYFIRKLEDHEQRYNSKMVAFNYFDRAVVLVWAINPNNVYSILKALKLHQKS